jgi:hypothetical protein
MTKSEIENKLNDYLKTLTKLNYKVRLYYNEPSVFNSIIDKVEEKYDVILKGRTRGIGKVAKIRMCLYYIFSEQGASSKTIAKLFNRNHATILNGIAKTHIVIKNPELNEQTYELYLNLLEITNN